MKSFYDRFMEPLEKKGIEIERKRLLKLVSGNVLEIGAGTGANLKFYNFKKIKSITLVDYNINGLLRKKVKNLNDKVNIKIIKGNGENLDFEDKSFDYIVSTLLFCSIPNVDKGLREIRRLLKDDGRFIFIEHVIPEDNFLKVAFNLGTPLWKKMANGCHLNRNFEKSLLKNDFEIENRKKFLNKIFLSGIASKMDKKL